MIVVDFSILPRRVCVQVLENVSIACADDEPIEVLREAVEQNVTEGVIDLDDVAFALQFL